jgi:hypothetical protein
LIGTVMAEAERRGVLYLFRLRLTTKVRGALKRAMRAMDWTDAGQGRQGKETDLRLMGWSRQRRIILLPETHRHNGVATRRKATDSRALECGPRVPASVLALNPSQDRAT